jgi:ABC-type sugar transport system ATPase subunit
LTVVLSPDVRVVLPGRLAGGDGDRAVTLGIRPQDLRVGVRGEPGAVPATVFAFEPLQEVGRLTVTLPGVATRVVIETDHHFMAESDDPVGLRFDPHRTHLFDDESGGRLAWQIEPAGGSSRFQPSSPATASS